MEATTQSQEAHDPNRDENKTLEADGTPTEPHEGDEQRYPDYLMEFPPSIPPEVAQRWQRFFDLREDILIDYGYQTARAYYTDLQDIFEWAVLRDKDILALTERDLKQYCALLRRRKYSENTIRRRMVAWRKMEARMSTVERSTQVESCETVHRNLGR